MTDRAKSLTHPRIRLVEGSSTDPVTLRKAKGIIPPTAGFVVLDSDHSRDHVLEEMNLYKEFVSLGSYMVVEDTNINGPQWHSYKAPGPPRP